MPNGMDRDFDRFMSSIAAFKEKYNHWPTKVRVEQEFSEELRDVMGEEDYRKLTNKIHLISDSVHP